MWNNKISQQTQKRGITRVFHIKMCKIDKLLLIDLQITAQPLHFSYGNIFPCTHAHTHARTNRTCVTAAEHTVTAFKTYDCTSLIRLQTNKSVPATDWLSLLASRNHQNEIWNSKNKKNTLTQGGISPSFSGSASNNSWPWCIQMESFLMQVSLQRNSDECAIES